MHHLLHVDDTTGTRPRKNTLQTAVSIPNLRAHREQDVFGKLLGWSVDVPASARQAAPVSATAHTSGHIASSSPTRGDASQGQATPVHTGALQGDAMRTPVKESFPYQLAPALQEASRTSIESTRDTPVASTSSPFGQGVRLPSQPRLKRKKSLQQLHGTIMAPTAEELAGNRTFDSSDSFDTSMKIRSLREVGSSETIRTAKGPAPPFSDRQNAIPHPPESPRTPLAVEHQRDAWMSDTRIFDTLQYTREETGPVTTGDLRDSLKPYSGETGRRHEVSALQFCTLLRI